jgi:tetratricopeptide (TPR) repeat protein
MQKDPEKWKGFLLSFGRFGELERLVEAKGTALSSAKTTDLSILCQAYAELKKYNKLFPCLDQMERNIGQGDSQWFDPRPLGGWQDASYYPAFWRARAYAELKDYDKAIDQATRAIALADASPDQGTFLLRGPALDVKLQAQGLLGVLYASLGHQDKARELLGAVEKSYGRTRATKAMTLAMIYLALGDFEQAYKSSLDEAQWTEKYMVGAGFGLGAEEGDTFMALVMVPQLFVYCKSAYETGRAGEAKRGYDKLLNHSRIKSFGELYWMILFDRGRIEENAGNREGAIFYYTKAVEVIEQQRSTIDTEISKIGFVGDKQQVYHRLVAALLRKARRRRRLSMSSGRRPGPWWTSWPRRRISSWPQEIVSRWPRW